jgi:hypothetical protein
MIDIPMIFHHAFLLERDQQKDVRILEDEARIPDSRIECDAERRSNLVTLIALSERERLCDADTQRFEFKASLFSLQTDSLAAPG